MKKAWNLELRSRIGEEVVACGGREGVVGVRVVVERMVWRGRLGGGGEGVCVVEGRLDIVREGLLGMDEGRGTCWAGDGEGGECGRDDRRRLRKWLNQIRCTK